MEMASDVCGRVWSGISYREQTQNFPKWNPNTRHSANLANITTTGCSRNLKNYASDVTFNYFYSDSRKVLRIKAHVLTHHRDTMINTVRQLMHNIRLFCGTECSAALSWRQVRTKFFFVPPMKQIPLMW